MTVRAMSLEMIINQPEMENLTTHNRVIYFKPREKSPIFIERVMATKWKIKLCLIKEYPGLCIKFDLRKDFEFEPLSLCRRLYFREPPL